MSVLCCLVNNLTLTFSFTFFEDGKQAGNPHKICSEWVSTSNIRRLFQKAEQQESETLTSCVRNGEHLVSISHLVAAGLHFISHAERPHGSSHQGHIATFGLFFCKFHESCSTWIWSFIGSRKWRGRQSTVHLFIVLTNGFWLRYFYTRRRPTPRPSRHETTRLFCRKSAACHPISNLRGWSTIWRFLSNISQFFRGNFTALDTTGLHDIAIGSHSTKSQFRSSEPICLPLIFHLSISFGEATAHKVGHGISFPSFGSFASSFLVVSVCDSTWRPGWTKGSD